MIGRCCALAASLPQADTSAKALMHQHGNATRAMQCPAAAQLPQAVSRDAGHSTFTSEMGFHNDDYVGIPIRSQEGGDFAEEAAATVPQ